MISSGSSTGMLSIPGEVVFRDLDGEALLIHMETGFYFGLDEVGATIWKAIEEHRTAQAAVLRLVKEYDAPAERVRGDVEAFVRTLVAMGLLVQD